MSETEGEMEEGQRERQRDGEVAVSERRNELRA